MPEFRPTHVVPRDGLSTWEAPDPGLPAEPLDAFLPVELMERVGDWGRVLCSNGWSAWVDARLLVSVPVDPPAARKPLARTADPRQLIARAEESLGRYRRAAEELAAGRADADAFHRRTRGLRVGMVVDGEALWLYDAEHERWVFCDGTVLGTYAVSAAPDKTDRANETDGTDRREVPGHEPTRIVEGLDEAGGPPAAPAGPPPTQVVNGPHPTGED